MLPHNWQLSDKIYGQLYYGIHTLDTIDKLIRPNLKENLIDYLYASTHIPMFAELAEIMKVSLSQRPDPQPADYQHNRV